MSLKMSPQTFSLKYLTTGLQRLSLRKKQRTRKRKDSYAIYIKSVLKMVHPDLQMSISSGAINVMHSFLKDMFERIAAEASCLVHYNKRSTLTSGDIATAVRLTLNGQLVKHALSEGDKAIRKYAE
jgi:histone H2B